LYDLNSNNGLPNDLKGRIRGIVGNVLSNFDYNYLNFWGELAVLNAITSKKIGVLNYIEFRLANGKHVDFVITNKNGEIYYIEVVSVNLHVHTKNVHY